MIKELIDAAIALRNHQGLSSREISSILNVSESECSKILERYPLTNDQLDKLKRKGGGYNIPDPQAKELIDKQYEAPSNIWKMFGSQMNLEIKGRVSEIMVAARFVAMGYSVLTSIFDGDSTDLYVVSPLDKRTIKIQVKTVHRNVTHSSISLVRKETSTNKDRRQYDETDFDYIIGYDICFDKCYIYSFKEAYTNQWRLTCHPDGLEAWDKINATHKSNILFTSEQTKLPSLKGQNFQTKIRYQKVLSVIDELDQQKKAPADIYSLALYIENQLTQQNCKIKRFSLYNRSTYRCLLDDFLVRAQAAEYKSMDDKECGKNSEMKLEAVQAVLHSIKEEKLFFSTRSKLIQEVFSRLQNLEIGKTIPKESLRSKRMVYSSFFDDYIQNMPENKNNKIEDHADLTIIRKKMLQSFIANCEATKVRFKNLKQIAEAFNLQLQKNNISPIPKGTILNSKSFYGEKLSKYVSPLNDMKH